jgi:hypothetical protein
MPDGRLTAIRCVCTNWLGVLHADGRVEVRHRGRRLIGRIDEIVCEHCGEVWRAPMCDTMPVRQAVGMV